MTSEDEDPGAGNEAAAAAAPLLTGSLGRERRVSFREARNGRGGRERYAADSGGDGQPHECPQCLLHYGGVEADGGGGGAEYRGE